MRKAILILTLVAAPFVAYAQGSDTDIQAVIQNQMQAFSDGDAETAFAFASPTIQTIFRNPENFAMMVENGFPMVWEPGEVTFQVLGNRNGNPVQRVQVIDQMGRLHLLDYEMTEIDGTWRISAVELVRAPSVGA